MVEEIEQLKLKTIGVEDENAQLKEQVDRLSQPVEIPQEPKKEEKPAKFADYAF